MKKSSIQTVMISKRSLEISLSEGWYRESMEGNPKTFPRSSCKPG